MTKTFDKLIVRIRLTEIKNQNEQYLLEFLNCWDDDFRQSAIQSNAVYTKTKYNPKTKELLIFYTYDISNPIHYLDSEIIEIIPYRVEKQLFNNYDKNPDYKIQGTKKIEKLTPTRKKILKKWIKFNVENKKKIKTNVMVRTSKNIDNDDDCEDDSPITIMNKPIRLSIRRGLFLSDK